MILTEDQLQEAARLSVHGTSSKSLIDRFYAEHQAAGTLPDKPRADIRAEMSNELRPTREDNAKFAAIKYGEIVATERRLRDEVWTQRHAEAAEAFYTVIMEQLAAINERLTAKRKTLADYYAGADGITQPAEETRLSSSISQDEKAQRDLLHLSVNLTHHFGNPLQTRKIK